MNDTHIVADATALQQRLACSSTHSSTRTHTSQYIVARGHIYISINQHATYADTYIAASSSTRTAGYNRGHIYSSIWQYEDTHTAVYSSMTTATALQQRYNSASPSPSWSALRECTTGPSCCQSPAKTTRDAAPLRERGIRVSGSSACMCERVYKCPQVAVAALLQRCCIDVHYLL
jgi:hypothetical protein